MSALSAPAGRALALFPHDVSGVIECCGEYDSLLVVLKIRYVEYTGFYINLAGSDERKHALLKNLDAIECADRYQRFDAVRGADVATQFDTTLSAGELGCWLSHLEIWRQARTADAANSLGFAFHIVEDDAVLTRTLPAFLGSFTGLPEWDIIFTDVYFHPPPTPEQFIEFRQMCRQFTTNSKISLIDLTRVNFTGTTSYLVNRSSLDKVLGLLDGRWASNMTLDLYLRKLVATRQINAYVTLPFLTTINEHNEASSIGNQGPALHMLNQFRRSFVVGADVDSVLATALSLAPPLAPDAHLGVYLELLRHVLGTIDMKSRS